MSAPPVEAYARRRQTYPNVRCYAFSPPGCVISEHGIPDMESHVLSVIVGDDLIPRISYQVSEFNSAFSLCLLCLLYFKQHTT